MSDVARELAGEAAAAHGRRISVEGVRRRPLARDPLASRAPVRDRRDPGADGVSGVSGQGAAPSRTGGPGSGEDAETPARIIVDIGELVLDGLPRIDRDLVAATFEAELTRLFTESRAPYPPDAPLGAGAGLDLAGLTALPPLPATTSADRLGRALARSVHAGLTARAVADE